MSQFSETNQEENPSLASVSQKLEKLGLFGTNLLRSIVIARIVGYGFLTLFILDLGAIIIPPKLGNPQWEFQVLGEVVERIAVAFISVCLIFLGGNYLRKGWEYPLLKGISWLCAVMGLIFILTVPLGIANTFRIDREITSQINQQIQQQLNFVENTEKRLQSVKNKQEMLALIRELYNTNDTPPINTEGELAEVKSNLSQNIKAFRNQLNQSKLALRQQRKSLIKQSVKWNLGALISGVLFIIIWQMTSWTRKID
ncbi:MAG: HpsJ family protein [Geminocystis sp.]|nr:HpsJ family protein [Geminocystis sp.]HIK38138.1 hypothetical protein [Geminocystis sp. M7585_C2015_104]